MVAVASNYSSMVFMMWMPLPLGLLRFGGSRFAARSRRGLFSLRCPWIALGLLVVLVARLIILACGGGSTSRGAARANVMVVGGTGSIIHSVPVTVNVQ